MNRAWLAAALWPAALLAACQSGYSVDVRNQTPQPVFVEMLVRYPNGAVTNNQGARLGPGDRGALGPIYTGPDNAVSFRVDSMPNPQRPAWIDLRPGMTILVITQPGEGSGGPLVVTEQAR